MTNPILGITIILLLIVVTFVFGLLFRGKFILVRYVLWGLCSILVIGLILNPFIKSKMVRDGEKLIVGVYRFDIESSKYDSVDLKNYSDLTMTVKPDNTFKINRATPFLKGVRGKWEYEDDGDIAFIKYSIDGDNESYESNVKDWYFDCHDNNEKEIGIIYFKKIKQ